MTRNVVEGGHALMLSVRLPERVAERVRSIVQASPETRRVEDSPHLTIAFFGRDQPKEVGDAVQFIAASVFAARIVPPTLRFRGLAMFGAGGGHLVAEVEPSEDLSYLRQTVERVAESLKVKCDRRFNPHVTLMVTTETGFADSLHPVKVDGELPLTASPDSIEVSGLWGEVLRAEVAVEAVVAKIGSARHEERL